MHVNEAMKSIAILQKRHVYQLLSGSKTTPGWLQKVFQELYSSERKPLKSLTVYQRAKYSIVKHQNEMRGKKKRNSIERIITFSL